MDSKTVQPMFPQSRAVPTAGLPFTSALPTEMPYEQSAFARGRDVVVSLQSGAYMAPNWVYPCRDPVTNSPAECFTTTLHAKNGAIDASCAANSQHCADSITRGLLSGLQPLLNQVETLFPDERLL